MNNKRELLKVHWMQLVRFNNLYEWFTLNVTRNLFSHFFSQLTIQTMW